MPAPIFRKLDCLLLRVDDLDAAVRFYSRSLGHALKWRSPKAVGLAMPDSDAELVLSLEHGPETDILVEDVPAAYARLLSAGAQAVAEPFEIPVGRCAVVRDPWGNPLTILDLSRGELRIDEDGRVLP